jgi:hypothetical protein
MTIICSSCGSQLDESIGHPASGLSAQHAHDIDLRLQLEETELEILRTQSILHQLKQKRASLGRAVNHLLSPVLRLPNELSTDIFLHCLPDMNLPFATNSLITPFYLGSICHTWRDLIWSTPQIWSIVSIDLSSSMPIDLLEEWFIRSDLLPLSIQVQLSYAYDLSFNDEDWDYHREVLDVIASVSNRWRDIDFWLRDRCFKYLRAILTPPAQLVTVSFHNLHSAMLPLKSFEMFLVSPQLRNIHLSMFMPKIDALPLGQLTTVSLDGLTLSKCLEVLKNGTRLTQCTFNNISDRYCLAPHQGLQASYIKSLSIGDKFPSVILLDHLICPAMLELELVIEYFSPFPRLISFIKRSSCSLQRLSITGDHPTSGEWLSECLRLMPCLVELKLSSRASGDELVRLLDPCPILSSSESDCLVPNLQIFEYFGEFDLNNMDISSMLLTRWRGGVGRKTVRLRRVNLRTTSLSSLEESALSKYRELKSMGMELSIGNCGEVLVL